MADTKFTPGPWKVFRAKNGVVIGVGDRNSGGITDCGDVSTNDQGVWRSGAERDANANLIAAAPELFEALHDLMSCLGGDEETAACMKAERALAKARGES